MNASDKIITAFLRLLKQTSYSKISINQLTAEVGITRTYFYQLFDNKDSLAQAALFTIIQQILTAFTASFDDVNHNRLNHQSIVRGITLIRSRQDELGTLLAVKQGPVNLNADFRHQLTITVTRALSRHFPQNSQLDYVVHVFIAATMETIDWTISHPNITTSQIVKMVDDFTGKGMLATLNCE